MISLMCFFVQLLQVAPEGIPFFLIPTVGTLKKRDKKLLITFENRTKIGFRGFHCTLAFPANNIVLPG